MNQDFYSFVATDIHGTEVPMESFRGKVVVVVNTASHCGFTPQFTGLEALYQKYKEQGLVILGFPCNQFAAQESGSEKEIQQFCSLNYGVTFPLFSKIEVNGPNAHPLFVFLKNQKGGFFKKDIKWNFTKFLIDKTGTVQKRFAPATPPEKMASSIESLLK